MRKTLLLTLAIAVVALMVPTASAGTLSFNYSITDYGAPCSWVGTEGGESTEIVYWQSNAAGRYLESDHNDVSHPDAQGVVGNGSDNGTFNRGGCTTAFVSASLQDGAMDLAAGDQVVAASLWTDDGAGAGISHANFRNAASWEGYMIVWSGQTDLNGNLTLANGLTDISTCLVGTYDAAADTSVVVATQHWGTGNTNWGHVEWSAAPVQVSNPAVNNMGTVVRGWDVYRSTADPALSTPADFSLVNTDGAVRNDGTGIDDPTTADAALASGLTGGTFYFNDRNLSDAAVGGLNEDTHYAVTPVLTEGPAWADGVRAYFEGTSWYPVSGKGSVLSNNPTDAQLVSFSAKLSERGDKVTLNWRTASEDGVIGFNIVRKFQLNGQDRGKAVKVNRNLIVAKGLDGGGADYSFVDSLRLPPQLKRARGLEVQYELEVVSVDGTSSAMGNSSVALRTTR